MNSSQNKSTNRQLRITKLVLRMQKYELAPEKHWM